VKICEPKFWWLVALSEGFPKNVKICRPKFTNFWEKQNYCQKFDPHNFSVRPEAIACGADLSFSLDVFYPSARSPRCVSRPAWNFAPWSELSRIL